MAAAPAAITQWNPNKKHSEAERWICIYPAYINSKKSRQEGRRLPKEKCVENPTFQEIKDVLSVCGLRFGVENKLYSRERSKELLFRGRIRVQIKNDDGTPSNPQFPTRDSVMLHVGTMIPQLKSRQGGARGGAEVQQPQSSGGGSKKKGGKRR
ncbi:Signal recognition particle 19 kDa protein [Pseudolycoriella hygida]|uniref:Signal recognition particle 19 kDa protein n=1 Tax=Pseudolycoriella hygida TaxID=35572 RepID=A0A9Q0N1A1_9DIPT|nr:Signal recognition particle 19 kDa protein [Pseudolycoriella hygida]